MSVVELSHPLTGEIVTSPGMSLDLPDGMPFDAWRDLGEKLCSVAKVINWWIGDWWAYGAHRYGERAKAAAQDVFGREFQTLANAATVSRSFETSRRREVLSWTHHAEVAALPAEEADALLDQAEREAWSTRELRQVVNQRKVEVGVLPSSDTCTVGGDLAGGSESLIAHTLKGEGFDAGEDGTGRGVPLIANCLNAGGMGRQDYETETFIAFGWQNSARQGASTSASASVTPTLDKSKTPAIAFSAKDHGADAGELAPTLRAGGHAKSHANAGVMPAVVTTLAIRGRGDSHDLEFREDGTANAVLTPNGGRAGIGVGAIHHASSVRRLTPRECERLQGFPDDWTLVPYRGKPAADGPRYKALGNSMAVPVMAWIGQRIAIIEATECRLFEEAK